MKIIIYFGICFLLVCGAYSYDKDRVLLSDISVLTLHADEYTTARRGKVYPQVKCVGGSGKYQNKYHPKVVQCYNRGSDGYDVNWECKADLPSFCSFGKMHVTCEGYDNSKDPYVLRGSCALEYELECKKSDATGSYFPTSKEEVSVSNGSGIMGLIIMVGIIVLIYYCCLSTRPIETPYAAQHGIPSAPASNSPNAPPPPGFQPNVYPDLNDHPPSYQDSFRDQNTRHRGPGGGEWYKTNAFTETRTDTNSGPGFWSGTLLGGLTGYVLGSSRSTPSHPTYTTTNFRSSSPDRTYFSSSQNGRDTETRSASGFATTSRR